LKPIRAKPATHQEKTPPSPSPSGRPSGGRRWLYWISGILALAAITGGIAWWWLASRPMLAPSGTDLGRLATRGSIKDLNLLVVTLDTTRADRIGAYGFRDIETPTLDRLANEGVLFEQAMASAPLTLPAHASLFTSLFPPEHGVRDNGGFFLAPSQVTLATMLKTRGFATGAVVGAYVLDGKWGLNQGFETYVDDFELPTGRGFGLGEVRRPGNEVVDRALPWLENVKDRRFFAWLHFYDPHTPYEPPEPFKSRYAEHPYAGAIAFTDSQVARVIEFLDRNTLLDRTVVAVIGDHGEGLNQHNEGTHGFFIYESTTRVPFIIRAPFETMRGRRIADPVRGVDLMPTALDLLGIAAPKGLAGVSLAPLMTGARSTLDLEGYAEALYPLHHFGWSELRAWRAGQYKVIDAPRPELYDLGKDPHETTNLYAERRNVADGMIARLRSREKEASSRAAAQPAPEVDPEARARLAALGYVGSFVATVSGPATDRADPKDKIQLFNLMTESREIAKDEKSFDRVVSMLNQVVAEDPKVIDAWFSLGNAYFKNRKYEDAIKYFQRALALKPDYDLPVINMANAYRRLGRDDAALAGYEHYLTLDPKNAHVHYQIGEIYLDRDDIPRAERSFRRALDIDKRVAPARNALGAIAVKRGDLATGERETRAAIAIKATVRLAHFNLGVIAEERGELASAEAEYKTEIELYPDGYRAAFNLSRIYERQNRINEQIARLKQSITANPLFAEGHFYLAKAYLDTGTNLPEAMSLARKGLEIDSRSPVAPLGHFVMAGVLLKQGQPAAAAAELARGNALEARLAREKQGMR
jgi:arylsulfatase A-like enzyme/Tfp pilus assembly protein PilF